MAVAFAYGVFRFLGNSARHVFRKRFLLELPTFERFGFYDPLHLAMCVITLRGTGVREPRLNVFFATFYARRHGMEG